MITRRQLSLLAAMLLGGIGCNRSEPTSIVVDEPLEQPKIEVAPKPNVPVVKAKPVEELEPLEPLQTEPATRDDPFSGVIRDSEPTIARALEKGVAAVEDLLGEEIDPKDLDKAKKVLGKAAESLGDKLPKELRELEDLDGLKEKLQDLTKGLGSEGEKLDSEELDRALGKLQDLLGDDDGESRR